MPVLVRSFSYTPDASFSEECLTLLMLVLVKNFSYTSDASFSQEFLMLDLVRCFSKEFLLQTSCSISGFSEFFLHS